MSLNMLLIQTAAAPRDDIHTQLGLGSVFMDAGPFQKLVMVLLVVASVAAIVICVRKLMSGPKLAGGSAFLSGLRMGGPLLGGLGAAYGLTNTLIGIASVPYPVTLKIVAPGLVEVVFMAGLGFLAGAVAIAAHWAVEARIDRTVLQS